MAGSCKAHLRCVYFCSMKAADVTALALSSGLSCASHHLFAKAFFMLIRKRASSGKIVSRDIDLIFDTWTPSDRCRPAHSKQTSTPKFTDAHVGLARPQSAQAGLFSRAHAASRLRIAAASLSPTCAFKLLMVCIL
jgi:hypothetical protein